MVSTTPQVAIASDLTRSKSLPPIYFYMPQRYWSATNLPQRPEEYWRWQNSAPNKYQWGMYNWTLQTYLYLKADGFPCELIGEMPDSGIVIAHKDFLSAHLKPSPKVLLICIQGDKTRHAYAQLHVVQNLQDEVRKSRPSLWDSCYMPHWIQSALIPRDPSRGDRFENIAYLGDPVNLAPELTDPSFQQQLEAMGLRWSIVGRDRWHDYHDIDAVIAIRSFTPRSDYRVKPALKLCNAWHAGVPAILGQEPAFQAERKGELDYFEVTSVEATLSAIQQLRDDLDLRHAIIANGRIRARETHASQLTARWRQFIANTAVTAYDRWCASPSWQQQLFLKRRDWSLKQARIQERWQAIASPSVKPS
jgi:hypothetical protein